MPLYVSQAELKTVGIAEVINMITQSDTTIVDQIIEETVDIFKTYMGGLYDVETVFNETGAARSKTVMKYVKDVAIHEIYNRASKELNEVVRLRYEDAMKWLDKVSQGKIDLNLPYAGGDDEDGDGNLDGQFFFHNGKKPYQSDF